MILYIEHYFIENLLINYIIISCTSMLIKRYNPKNKKILGSTLGAIYSLAYLYPKLGILFTIPLKVIIMTVITLISFSYSNKKEYFHIALIFYLVNVFISGSTFFIIYFTGISHLKISFLIICVYTSCQLLKYIYKDIKMINYIKQLKRTITINLLEKRFECEALIDSGNLLKDPISNQEVVIVKASFFKGIIPENILSTYHEELDIVRAQEIIDSLEDRFSKRVRLIPYKHAGSIDTGVILGFKADYIEVEDKKIGNIVLGVSNFENSDYGAIINPNVLLEI